MNASVLKSPLDPSTESNTSDVTTPAKKKYVSAKKSEVKKKSDLSFFRRIAFATGHVLHVLGGAMWYPYDVTFFSQVLLLPASSVGTIILVGQWAGAFGTPLIGIWSDHTRLRRYRRKVFHLAGVLLGAASFFFMWHACINCSNASVSYQVLYFSLFSALFQFSWACSQIAQLSMIPELTNDRNIKVELNSIRFCFTMSSFLVVFVIIWILLSKFGGSGGDGGSTLNPSDAKIFWVTALIVIIVGFSVAMCFQLFIHEKTGLNPPKLPWHKWLRNPQFFLIMILFMSTRIVLWFPQTYLPPYLTTTLLMDKASIAKGPLIFYIASILTTLVVKRFNKLIGINLTYFIGLVFTWAGLMWFWVKERSGDQSAGFEWGRDNVYGGAILLGIGSSTMVVIAFTNISFLVGKYTGSSAFVYGWMLFSDRFSNGILVKIAQSYQPLDGTTSIGPFYRSVLVYPTGAASLLGLLALAIIVGKEWYTAQQKEAMPPITHEYIINEGRRKEYILSDEARHYLTPVMKEEESPPVITFFF